MKKKLRVTVGMVMHMRPCPLYNREYVTKLFGRKTYLTALDILKMKRIPLRDRLWVVLGRPLLSVKDIHELGCIFTEYALRCTKSTGSHARRSRKIIQTKREWIAGTLTTKQLEDRVLEIKQQGYTDMYTDCCTETGTGYVLEIINATFDEFNEQTVKNKLIKYLERNKRCQT